MSRVQQILDSVDHFLQTHKEWEEDETSPVVPTIAFESSIKQMIDTCDFGDVPSSCRDLCLAVSRLAIEWDAYENALPGKRTGDHRPVGSFWGALRNVMTCRAHATPVAIKQPESVASLLEQKVPLRQIAFYIWGHAGKGPFITDAGQVDEAKLRDEAANPGKHTSGWIHPEQLDRQSEAQRALQTRLGVVSARENTDAPVDKASIAELLNEQQYPDVIARVKRVSLDVVLEEAKRLGITPNVRPNLASERSWREPSLPGATEQPSAKPVPSDDDDDVNDDGAEILEQHQSDEEMILALNDGTRGAAEIVAEMKKDGRDISYQKVTSVIKKAKTPVAS